MLLWIIITFIYFTMNVFIQRILLLSVGILLICMCSNNIHKLSCPRDRKKSDQLPPVWGHSEWISAPVKKLFWEWAMLASEAGCQNTLLSWYLQRQKHCIFIPMDQALKRSHPYILEPLRESFSLAVNENKGKRWKESSFTGNKKASTKQCINVESGGEVHCILVRVEK